jgi:osmotically-inducible protein OsmY
MADRYENRYRGGSYRDERGFVERAGDEVRSWFGDEEAQRRRQRDTGEHHRPWERERGRGPEFGHADDYGGSAGDFPDRGTAHQGWGGERGATSGAWSEPRYGYAPGRWSAELPESGWAPQWSRYGMERGDEQWRRHGTAERQGAGGFAGRGPKGYQRSDARITEDVCDRLTDAPDLDASDIEVRVNNGEVTLGGTVRTRGDKRLSEDLIERVAGVREVHNNLRVGQAAAQEANVRS